MLQVREILPGKKSLRAFVRLPLDLRGDDPNTIIPSVAQQVRGLLGRHNALIANGVQAFLVAYEDGRAVGRLLAGIDFRAVQQTGRREGYVSMFECIDSQTVADALFAAAEEFLRRNGMQSVAGPSPAMLDDFGMGLLVQGFDIAPTFLSPYNPAYYPALFEGAGFAAWRDMYTYALPLSGMNNERYENVLRRAGKRFGYTVENVDFKKDPRGYARAFARVIAESTPPQWGVVTPTSETLYSELKRVERAIMPQYTTLAYVGERPIGMLLVIPDYNPALRGLRGHVFPVGTLRLLFARPRMKKLRSVMLYVVPEYQNKGVEAVMINRVLRAARDRDIEEAEAAMINGQNLKMRLGVERLGGTVAKVHRQYRKDLTANACAR